MQHLRRHAGLTIRLAISVAILTYLARTVNWSTLSEHVAGMDRLWLAAAFACFGPMLALCAWRWKILLRVQDIDLPFWQSLQLGLVGHFFNSFLLGVTGGDVVKIYYATRAAPEKKAAAGLSVIVDRLFGLVVLLVIAVILCVAQHKFLTAPVETSETAYVKPVAAVYLTLSIAAATFAIGLLSFRMASFRDLIRQKGCWEKIPLHLMFDHLIEAYERYGSAWKENAAAFFISVMNHSLGMLLAYCIVLSLHLDVPFWPFVSILPILSLIIALPISIGGLGVREGLAVVLFSLMGLSKEHAVTFALTHFAINLAWSLVGSVFYLRYQTPQTEE